MADEVVTQPEAPALPEKPWYESNSMWASIAAFITGLGTLLGFTPEVASFVQVEFPKLVGAFLTLLGVYNAWAALRRNSTITVRKG